MQRRSAPASAAKADHRLFLLVLLVGLTACGGDSGGPTEPPPPVPTTISIATASDTLRAIGAAVTFQATVRDQHGNVMTPMPPLTWTSSDPSVSTVADGVVTALKNGSATITASVGSASATAVVHVVQQASGISLSVSTDTLQALGASLTIGAVVRDAGGADVQPAPAVSWTSSAPGVAAVENGIVTAVEPGSSSITASTGSVSATAQVYVVQRPSAMARVSGDDQTGPAGSTLGEPLVLRVEDSGGAPVPGTPVAWSIDSGGGHLTSVDDVTDSAGLASATWTLGPATGEQAVRVSAGEPAAVFFATATGEEEALSIQDITPAVLVEDSEATLFGTGLYGATVDVGGMAASVTAASATQLTFTVPAANCQPLRSELVTVRRGSDEATRAATVQPAHRIAPMEFGDIWLSTGTGAQGHCLPLEAHGEDVRYVIGVQSLSESVTSMTPALLRITSSAVSAVVAPGGLAAYSGGPSLFEHGREHRRLDVVPATPTTSALRTALAETQTQILAGSAEADRRRQAHAEHTARNLDLLRDLRSRTGELPTAMQTQAAVQHAVGGQIDVRVPASCETYTSITATVKVVGSRAIWVEDNARPADGFTDAQYAALGALYDGTIGAEIDRYLGSPTDFDGNGRVVIVVTPEVNKLQNVNGFVWTVDFFPTSVCEASNVGEYFYVVAPDPYGTTPRQMSVVDAQSLYPALLAHEMTHVVHLGQQLVLAGNPSLPLTWEAEGLATFMEELVGHAFTGFGSGQNLGLSAVQQGPEWYGGMFLDLRGYYGFQTPTSQLATAPHECSWLGRPPNGPCMNGNRLPYGVPASLLRWIADFAWTPATEAQMTREIVYSTTHGFPLLAALASDELHWVKAYWAIALATDGLYFGGGGPTFTSWNMHDVFSALPATARLNPRNASYAFNQAFNVRGGSVAFFTVAGAHTDLAVAAENLPSTMRLWIVRVE